MAKSHAATGKPEKTVLIDFDVAADGTVTGVSSSLPPRVMRGWPNHFQSVAEGEEQLSGLLAAQSAGKQQILVCFTAYRACNYH